MATNITRGQLVLFSLPWAVSAIMHGPIAGVVPSLYAEAFALDLAVVGSVLLLARVFDAVTDPVIGFLSDRTISPLGKRKPWILVGAAITVFAIWFLYRPGDSSTTTYFLTFSILLYLGWTVMEIPAVAWILEMSRDTQQRTRINTYRTGALFVGGIIFYVLPSVVPDSDGSMNLRVLGLLAIGIAITVPITTLLMVRFVPEGEVFQSESCPRLTELWQSIKNNRPFLAFLGMYAFIGIASGISGVIGFMYIDTYIGIGTRFTELFLPAVVIGPLTLPLWLWVLNRFGKYRTTAWAFTIYAMIMPVTWLVPPGEAAFVPFLIYFTALSMFVPLLMITMPAILGDIIDYDELKTGKNRAGQYSAFLTLIGKGTTAVGGPLALVAIGLFGYQPGAEVNDETAILGLRLVFNLLPPLLVVPGLVLLWRFPINDEKQLQIKRELETRAEQQIPPALGEPA